MTHTPVPSEENQPSPPPETAAPLSDATASGASEMASSDRESRSRWSERARRRALDWNAPPSDPDMVAFQPAALSIENRPAPVWARSMIQLILGIVVVLLVWAAWARMDITVSARGKILADQPNIVLQPLDTAIIHAIPVKVGDPVVAGQVVAELDPTFSTADLSTLRQRRDSLKAQIERVQAQLQGELYAPQPDPNEFERIQKQVFDHQVASFTASQAAKQAEIDTLDAHQETLLENQKQYQAQLSTASEQERMYQTLMGEGVGSRVNLLVARIRRQETERQLASADNEMNEGVERRLQLQAELAALIRETNQKLAEELMAARGQLIEVEENLNKAERRQEMITLRAPVDATVLSVTPLSVGSVIRQAESLIELVPVRTTYQAEVRIPARDIRDITVGLPARLKFDAYPFQKFGVVNGTLEALGGDAQIDKDTQGTQEAYYMGRISLDWNTVDPRIQIIPGIQLSAELRTGDRRILSYFLYPLIRTLDESFKDR
ncbi:HlyD family type I secretion periplasmic adaptor subunit [Pararhodospirillum oryzae]|uniref:Membrane fusion protein (MFP) family protein n=1 Tax=Pararhodospirillum oryzae TaxID=478448 RepID=A0A512H7U7_9PROT|nr:HlyD family type I secretion periplasmic adaptor subunit [Pararhodospirillum oryzae]GEO81527.1 HlyD family type I secretion periplasmic adaptor subunit [Pararhodospirillum oryzae]